VIDGGERVVKDARRNARVARGRAAADAREMLSWRAT
jgi:hypothetical protein